MISFVANTIAGAGRGKKIGYPTMNVRLCDVPAVLETGIYACTVNDEAAVMHYGPRTVFNDGPACEFHLLYASPPEKLKTLSITVIERIRDVQDFDSAQMLRYQIKKDVQKAKTILHDHL